MREPRVGKFYVTIFILLISYAQFLFCSYLMHLYANSFLLLRFLIRYFGFIIAIAVVVVWLFYMHNCVIYNCVYYNYSF